MEEPKTRVEKLHFCLNKCNEKLALAKVGEDLDEEFKIVQISILADIAESLAVIADHVNIKDGE